MKSQDKKSIMKGYDLIHSRVYNFLTLWLLRHFIILTHRRLIREVERSSSLILDVGCGTGTQLLMMVKEGFRGKLIGADVSNGMLRIAARKIRQNGASDEIELIRCDAENLPIKENAFEALTSAGLYRFLPAPERATKEALRVLKNRGIYVLREFAGPRKGIKEIRHIPMVGHPIFTVWRLRSDRIIADLLSRSGFEDVTVFREGKIPHIPIAMGGIYRTNVFAKGKKQAD